jgi:N-ethylmaleimide reductase
MKSPVTLRARLARINLIAFGRPFLFNQDLVQRMRSHAALNEPDMATFYTPGAAGYTDYPTL